MSVILLATDVDYVYSAIDATLASHTRAVHRVRAGVDVIPAIHQEEPELVILDLQIGNQGGMATCMDMRLEQDMGRVPDVPILMLLDRDDDIFLAKRSTADGWLIKPVEPWHLRRATATLLKGDTYFQTRRQVS